MSWQSRLGLVFVVTFLIIAQALLGPFAMMILHVEAVDDARH